MDNSYKDIPGEILAAAENLPAISPVIGKINEISRQMNPSPLDMVRIIMIDPVLTFKVLKLVNSSFYGLPQHINSLAQAVVLLGMNTIKNLAISTAVFSTLMSGQQASPIKPEEFWLHCLGTAVGCKLIARELKVSHEVIETFFVSGLLHDIGKILFIRMNTDKYRKALEESRRLGVSLCFAEQAHFGCSHADAGGMLAREWLLDEPLIRIIELHHFPPEGGGSLMETVIIANNICKGISLGQSGNRVIEETACDSAIRLGIGTDILNGVKERLPAEMGKAAEFLNFLKEQDAGK